MYFAGTSPELRFFAADLSLGLFRFVKPRALHLGAKWKKFANVVPNGETHPSTFSQNDIKRSSLESQRASQKTIANGRRRIDETNGIERTRGACGLARGYQIAKQQSMR